MELSNSITELSTTIPDYGAAEQYFHHAFLMGEMPMYYSTTQDFGTAFSQLNNHTHAERTSGSIFSWDLPRVKADQTFGSSTVTTGILSNQLIHVPGGVGQFVASSNIPDAPIPAEILIQYCKLPSQLK